MKVKPFRFSLQQKSTAYSTNDMQVSQPVSKLDNQLYYKGFISGMSVLSYPLFASSHILQRQNGAPGCQVCYAMPDQWLI